MYRILLVDEEEELFDDFRDYVEYSQLKSQFTILSEYPLADINEMMQLIIEVNPDAIITDFMLNAIKTDIQYNVPYNGSMLVKEWTAIREDFPCFILTSFDDQAVNQSFDVNIVYIKNLLHKNFESETKARATFLERVKSQIDHYKTSMQSAEAELLALLEKRKNNTASISDEQKIIELDHFLESKIDRKSAIPPEFKELSNTKRLDNLLNKVDDILKRIDNGDGI